MWHNTQCKFCRVSITVEIDDACPPLDVQKWVGKAACNLCADFHRAISHLSERMEKICAIWLQLVNSNAQQPHKAAFEEKLTTLTKLFTSKVARHYQVMNAWSSELVDALLESPGKCRGSLRAYERNLARRSERFNNLPFATPSTANP